MKLYNQLQVRDYLYSSLTHGLSSIQKMSDSTPELYGLEYMPI